MEVLGLVRAHGLDLDPSSLHIIEMGLDFRVVLASDAPPVSGGFCAFHGIPR